MAQRPLSLNAATIGPASWRNNTVKEIKISQNIVNRSDKACVLGRALDPLPHLRDTVAQLSNDEAHRYFRQTRGVVCLLRESLLDTNEEIKVLTRGKEALEKALEHRRKDLKLNLDSQDIRVSRPSRERLPTIKAYAGIKAPSWSKDHDGVDDLLQAERSHLLNLKKMLEAQLKLVQQQLQVLDNARSRLNAAIQERSRVLDLICHAISSVNNTTGRTMQRSWSSNGSGRGTSLSEAPRSPVIDPLGPYTPEVDQALQEARDARSRSCILRKELVDLIDRSQKMQKAAHKSVNDGLTGKVAETVTLKQHLQVANGENRHAIHRSQRWYDATEKAWGYTRGPVTSSDLTTRERLDRPIIRVFQRHPGTNMPEAQEVVTGGDGLLQSLTATSRNIALLKMAQDKLKDDIRDKSAAVNVDGSIVRLRRRKANHKWVMGEAF